MAVYVMLTNLTAEGKKTVKDTPNRIKEVNQEFEKMGVKVLSQYALLGPYDFVNIIDAPDHATMAKVATELGSRGTLNTMTMAAFPIEDISNGASARRNFAQKAAAGDQ